MKRWRPFLLVRLSDVSLVTPRAAAFDPACRPSVRISHSADFESAGSAANPAGFFSCLWMQRAARIAKRSFDHQSVPPVVHGPGFQFAQKTLAQQQRAILWRFIRAHVLDQHITHFHRTKANDSRLGLGPVR